MPIKSVQLVRTIAPLLLALLIAVGTLASAEQSTTTLTVSPSGSVSYGTSVTLTATVTGASSIPVLAGFVTFYDQAQANYIATLQLVATSSGGFAPGTATLRLPSLSVGQHSFTAVFSGEDGVVGSTSAAKPLNVTGTAPGDQTQTSLVYSGFANGQYSLNATVLGIGPQPNYFGGSITFTDTTTGTTLGTSPLNLASMPPYAFMMTGTPVPSQCTQVVAAGDFNNDGFPDLVTASPSSDSSCTPGNGVLTVLLGNGDGTFTPAPSSSGLLSPNAIVTADFNADGNLDVAVNQLTSTGPQVLIFLGKGDGTFQPPIGITFLSGHEPEAIAVGDFNYDGIPDLTTGRINGTDLTAEITTLLGNGDGTFAPPTSYPFSFPAPAQSSQDTAPHVSITTGEATNSMLVGEPQLGTGNIYMPVGSQLAVLFTGPGGFQPLQLFSILNSELIGGVTYGQVGVSIAPANPGDGSAAIVVESRGDTPPPPSLPLGPVACVISFDSPPGDDLPSVSSEFCEDLPTAAGSPSPIPASFVDSNPLNIGNNLSAISIYGGVPQFTLASGYYFSFQPEAQLIPTPGYVGLQVATADFRLDGTSDVAVAAENGIDVAEIASSGTAQLTVSAFPGFGPQKITATFIPTSGDDVYVSSTSNSVTITVDPLNLTSNLPASLEALLGTSVQFTASVTTSSGLPAPTGSIQFYDGTATLGSPVPLANAIATYSSSSFSKGAHSVTAVYSGDSNYVMTSSSAIAFTIVAQGSQVLSVNVPSTAAVRGVSFVVTPTFQQTPPVLGPAPTGTINLLDNGTVIASGSPSSTFTVNTVAKPLADGQASFAMTYSGDSNWPATTSAASAVAISQITPVISGFELDDPLPANGGSYSFDAFWQVPTGSPFTTAPVTLLQDGVPVLGATTNVLTNGPGPFALIDYDPAQFLLAGAHVYSFSFPGDVSFNSATSNTLTVTVPFLVPTLSLTFSLGGFSSVVQGGSIAFTLTSGGNEGVPTGAVQFSADGTALGSPVTLNAGIANFSTSALSAGQHTVTASYAGNSYYNAATASTAVTVIAQGQDTVTLSPIHESTVSLGTPIAIDGTLAVGAMGPAPTGTVQLLDHGTSIASVALSGNPPVPVAFNVNSSSLPIAAGSHAFSLKYLGDIRWAASASSSAAITITRGATVTTANSSATSAPAGSSVSFTATIAGGVGSLTPTGTVQFLDGTANLGSQVKLTGASATLTTSKLSAGAHSITAAYFGDANYESSTSTPVTEMIEDFTFEAETSTLTVSPGGSATVKLAIATEGGLDASTSLSCSGLPTKATCTFDPSTVTGSGSTTLTIDTTASEAAISPSPFERKIAGGSALLACAFGLFLPLRRRRKRYYLLFSSFLAMSVLGLTLGCGGGGKTGGGNTGTPPGTYSVAVTATTGSGSSAITHATTLNLVVK